MLATEESGPLRGCSLLSRLPAHTPGGYHCRHHLYNRPRAGGHTAEDIHYVDNRCVFDYHLSSNSRCSSDGKGSRRDYCSICRACNRNRNACPTRKRAAHDARVYHADGYKK